MKYASISLKRQDLFVLLVMLARGGRMSNYVELAIHTGLAASVLHGTIQRCLTASLMRIDPGYYVVSKPQLKEFVFFGARYVYPTLLGSMVRGVPTSYAAAPLNSVISATNEAVPVWPSVRGTVRGLALIPLHANAPDCAMRDEKIYAVLSLFDAIRTGQTRERNAARELLEPFFQKNEILP